MPVLRHLQIYLLIARHIAYKRRTLHTMRQKRNHCHGLRVTISTAQGRCLSITDGRHEWFVRLDADSRRNQRRLITTRHTTSAPIARRDGRVWVRALDDGRLGIRTAWKSAAMMCYDDMIRANLSCVRKLTEAGLVYHVTSK